MFFGWGSQHSSIETKLADERRETEANMRLYGEDRFSAPNVTTIVKSPIESQLLKLMPFDEGWDFRFAERVVYGRELQRGPQNIGNCVGYSNCLLLATRIAHEILVRGDLELTLGDYGRNSPVPFIPYAYGAGRCLSGNMCGNFDGSYCSVQIRANLEHGILPSDLDVLSEYNVPQGSARTGRRFGSSRSLVQKYRKYAIDYKLEHSYQVETVDSLWDAIVEKKMPCQICSSWGFRSQEKREWFYIWKQSGRWAHSMQIIAAFKLKGQMYFMIGNQWGNYHNGTYWFVVTAETMEKWLRQADCRTIGNIAGRQYLPDFFGD